MGLFDEMLKDNETLFLNEIALDFDFMPKQVQYRESENQHIATVIKPLFHKRNGSNLLIYGSPGIGKTLAVKKVLEELEEVSEDIIPVYINCWQSNSSYKVVMEICKTLGYVRIMNKNTNDLVEIVIKMLNKSSSVLIFDEIDKVNDLDFLYALLEKVYRKSIILLTNYKDTLTSMDERIKSRLLPELLEFRAYSLEEVRGILEQRKKFAFVEGVWDESAFDEIVGKCYDLKDIRKGLYLLKESGNCAELRSSKNITEKDTQKVLSKLKEFTQNDKEGIDLEEKKILELVDKEYRIGDLYNLYKENGGDVSYKTFTRKVENLAKGKFLYTQNEVGKEGNTTIISKIGDKKLSEF